ncbi:MAG: DUF4139 domain-containing protein [Cypionkella sp.]
MRYFAILALILPTPAFADTVLATSHISAVTIYPQGAQVTREVSFTTTPGAHDLLITDLPAQIEPGLISLKSPDATLGAFSLRTDRLPPRAPLTSPQIEVAKATLKAAEAGLRDTMKTLDAINAEVEAQQAKIAFLNGIKIDGAGATAEGLIAIADMVEVKVRAARQAIQQAQAGMPAANELVTQEQDVVDQARAALDALSKGSEDYAALSVSVTTEGTGPAHLTVTHFVASAAWTPVYDMALDRKAAKLTVDRGVLVSQSSGEDWAGVSLTLSTARPSDQSAPSTLYPDLKQITDPEPPMGAVSDNKMGAPLREAAPMVASRSMTAAMEYQGDTVVYHYPSTVDVANGVESLRLALDQLIFTPKIVAQAVPRYDATAFLLATLTNDSTELLLPGHAYLTRDGALVGDTDLKALASGAKVDLGFGAIDGLKLTRDMPERAQGDRGIFTSSTQLEEKAVLKVENLTDEAWPVHLLDQVPYSEQEDLKITYTADPAPTAKDVEGQRGVLAWDFDLAPKAKKEIKLDSVLNWPQGKVLQ